MEEKADHEECIDTAVALMGFTAVEGEEREVWNKENGGADHSSPIPAAASQQPHRVKGSAAGARHIILKQNEVSAALNAPERWHLALVEVSNGFVTAPAYFQNIGLREPAFVENAVVLDINRLKGAGRA